MIIVYNTFGALVVMLAIGAGVAVAYACVAAGIAGGVATGIGVMVGGIAAAGADFLYRRRNDWRLFSPDHGGHVFWAPVWLIGAVSLLVGAGTALSSTISGHARAEAAAAAENYASEVAELRTGFGKFRDLRLAEPLEETRCLPRQIDAIDHAYREVLLTESRVLQAVAAREPIPRDRWVHWLVISPLFGLLDVADLGSTDPKAIEMGLRDGRQIQRPLGVLVLSQTSDPWQGTPGEMTGWLVIVDRNTAEPLCQGPLSVRAPLRPSSGPNAEREARRAFIDEFREQSRTLLARIAPGLTILGEVPPD